MNADRRVDGLLNLFMATGLSAVLGAVGGAILAGPFWFFGVIAGVMYALPAGVAIGVIAWARKWPTRCVQIVCLCEFVGALVLGFGGYWLGMTNGGPPDCAFTGEVVGVMVGIVLAEVRNRPPADPSLCRICGYNLTGNVSGVCPECGTHIPINSVASVPSCLNQQEKTTEGTEKT